MQNQAGPDVSLAESVMGQVGGAHLELEPKWLRINVYVYIYIYFFLLVVRNYACSLILGLQDSSDITEILNATDFFDSPPVNPQYARQQLPH